MIGAPNPLFIAIGFFLIMFGVINLALSAPGSYEIDVEHHVSMFCILYGLAYILFVVFTEPVFTALVGWSAGAAIHMIVFWVGLLGGLYALSVHQ